MIEIIISFALATSILSISPGPDNIFVLTQSIVNGTKYGLATVFGLMSGCLVHTTLVAFGVSAIIKENESIFFGIKLIGASYLIFLAFKVYKSDSKIVLSNATIKKESILQLFKKGFIMNVLNPKVALFFLAFFPQFLYSKTISTIIQFYTLGGVFILDIKHLLIDLVGGHSSSEHSGGGKISSVSWIRSTHHVLGIEHLLGKFWYS